MIKRILSIAALWLLLAALVFVYTDRDEYTWRFSPETLRQVLISYEDAASREDAAQQAMEKEKNRVLARQGQWESETQYVGAPKTRPAVDEEIGLNLMWGEYEVSVSYSSPEDMAIFTVSALRQPFIRNGYTGLSASENTAFFTFTLTDSCEQVVFACNLPQDAQIYDITVHKAGSGVFSRDLAAYALLAGAVLTVLLILSWDRRPCGATRRRDALIIVMTALFASMPLMFKGVYDGHDLFFHLNRIEGIAAGLRAGQFPVAIHASTLLGYGYAAPQFYPEIFLYIPAFLRNLGVSLAASVRVYEAMIHLAAATVFYLSARAVLSSRRTALGAMMLYMLCSYRLSNVYARAAIAESMAMVFFPLLIWALYEVLVRDEKKWPLLALSMAGIFLSHLLSTLFAAGMCVLCALLCARKLIREPRRILACAKAALVMILCSACFLVPFLHYARAGINTSVALMSSEHVLRPGALFVGFPGNTDHLPYEALDFSYSVGVVPGLAIVLGCAILAVRLYSALKARNHHDTLSFVFLVLGSVLVFMSTEAFPWAWACTMRLGVLFQQIQYPWRLVGVAAPLLSFAAAWGYMRDEAHRTQALCLIAALCVVFAGYGMQAIVQDVPLLEKEDFCDTRIDQYEYIYEGTEKGILVPGEIVALDAPEFEVSNYMKQGTDLSFTLSAPQGFSSIEVPLLYYPGYQAEADGVPCRVVKGNNNVVRIYGVTNTHGAQIRVWFDPPMAYKAAALVSAAGFALLIALMCRRRRA